MPAAKPNPVVRRRIELAIGLVSPLLDLVLAVGDRTSRLLGSDEPDHVPARARPAADAARRGLGPRDNRRKAGSAR